MKDKDQIIRNEELFKDFKIEFINHIEDFYEANGKTYSSFHYHVLIRK